MPYKKVSYDMSEEFQAFREKHGLSQSQAARVLEVSTRTLQGWEMGRKIDHKVIYSLALNAVTKKMIKEKLGD